MSIHINHLNEINTPLIMCMLLHRWSSGPYDSTGSLVTGLDVCNGKFDSTSGSYAYWATTSYPYFSSCFGPGKCSATSSPLPNFWMTLKKRCWLIHTVPRTLWRRKLPLLRPNVYH